MYGVEPCSWTNDFVSKGRTRSTSLNTIYLFKHWQYSSVLLLLELLNVSIGLAHLNNSPKKSNTITSLSGGSNIALEAIREYTFQGVTEIIAPISHPTNC